MAHHNKTPQSVLDAPPRIWAWAEDKDGNPIAFEGANRQMLRRSRVGVKGYSRSSISAQRRPEHALVTARKEKLQEQAGQEATEKRANVAKRWWKRHKKNDSE